MINLLEREEIKELNPMQKDAIAAGIDKGKNIVIAAPTASGKTLCAEFAIVNKVGSGMCIYIVPLRALAEDKYESFKKVFYDLKVGVATGDYDSSAGELGNYDLLIVTPEKMDSILRHSPVWLSKICLVVADEIHLINDVERGPNLEVVLARLKQMLPGAQMVALSATIKNCDEITGWLNATLVKSDYRPVKLNHGVYYDGVVWLEGKSIEAEGIEGCFEKLLKDGKQGIVFVSTRKSAEAVAERLAELQKTNEILDKVATRMESGIEEHKTTQTKRLAKCLRKGIAFHHAGLTSKERHIIQKAFKEKKLLKGIVCTTTLAMGIDYPASVVIVRDLRRFDGFGSDYLPVLEVQQMIGRAGRPRYDTEGVAVLMCKSADEANYLTERYYYGESEPIFSKLGVEPVLRFHLLAAIASGYTTTYEALERFIASTFFAFQYGNTTELFSIIERILNDLEKMGFIKMEKSEKAIFMHATPVGRRVSELYIDPLSAKQLIDSIEIGEKEGYSELGATMLICSCAEIPPINVSKKEEEELWQELYSKTDELLMDKNEAFTSYDLLPRYKASKVMMDWMNEKREEEILEKYGVPPGILFSKTKIGEWMFYSASEIARMKHLPRSERYLKGMNERMKKGIKEELLPLTKIKGVGRARARRLFNAGYKTPDSVFNEAPEKIRNIIGVDLRKE